MQNNALRWVFVTTNNFKNCDCEYSFPCYPIKKDRVNLIYSIVILMYCFFNFLFCYSYQIIYPLLVSLLNLSFLFIFLHHRWLVKTTWVHYPTLTLCTTLSLSTTLSQLSFWDIPSYSAFTISRLFKASRIKLYKNYFPCNLPQRLWTREF